MFDIKRKIFFLHIPKTGGTSIEHSFNLLPSNKNGGWEIADLGVKKKPLNLKRPIWHARLRDVEPYVPFLNEYTVFTIVRNPFTRFASQYFCPHSCNFRTPNIHNESITKIKKDFNRFVIETVNKPTHVLHTIEWGHFDTQSNMIKSNFNINVKLFKYEDMLNVQTWLCEIFKDKNFKLSRLNSRLTKTTVNYMKLYDKETYNLVYKCYEEDFKNFNYN